QDSVRGCSLGFAAAVIADGRLQRACKAEPHRSRRALLTHRAPPSGSGVEAVTRQRVYSSDWRKEAGGELDEPLPAEACRLAAPLERCEPEPLHVFEEPPQARVVIGYQSNVRQKKDRLAAVSPNPISTWSSDSLERLLRHLIGAIECSARFR